ncbi:JAB domain-containing protein [Rossellomorea arthrocnemi]|uniref:JAB domain-containing protein n=1 Tax=Rossellomorea arthrocnemi TaxID=2769542 RepID=UPI00191A784F
MQFIGICINTFVGLICLNIKNQVIAVHRSHIGTLSYSSISPREIFIACILNNAMSFVITHNQPSTIIKPSKGRNNFVYPLNRPSFLER